MAFSDLLKNGVNKLFGNKDQDQDLAFGDQVADFVNKEYQKRQNERKPFELQWRLNVEFISGNQYLDLNPVSNTIEEIPKMYWWQEREVFNQVATIYETRVARLSRQMPIMKTRPASSDDMDISASKITSMLCQSTWHDQNMNDKYQGQFTTWLESVGTVLIKPVWSTSKGRVIQKEFLPSEDQQQNQIDQMIMANQQVIEIREGDIDSCIVPAHEFFPDSSYRNDIEQCRSVIHARAYHVDDVENMWGKKVEPEKVDVLTLQSSSGGASGLGYASGGRRYINSQLDDHVVLKEYYERQTKKYPFGRFLVVAGKELLHAGPLPYMLGEDGDPDLPFIRCVSIDNPGVFWGKTVVERCIPIQRRYNALRNRKAEYLNLVTIGQWRVPDGSIEEDTEINNAPGNIMYYRPGMNGAAPEPISFPSLPASFENEIQTLLAEFTAVSGVSELSRMSEAPSGVKSGVALSIANEQDNTRIASTAANIENAIAKLGKYWIRLYRQFVQEPRILRNVGSNNIVDVREWSASDLRSDDIIIENASALSETPSQRRQMVFDLIGTGIFNRQETNPFGPEGVQKIMEMLEFGNWENGFTDELNLQKNRARRENMKMMEGQFQQVMDFDDHMIHIQTHNHMRMQAEYEQLLQTPYGPLIDEMVRLHISQHIQMEMARMPQQQSDQQTSDGQEQTQKSSDVTS